MKKINEGDFILATILIGSLIIFLIVINGIGNRVRCIDGDTFRKGDTYYRLAWIDTPEKGEKGYREASNYTCGFLRNTFGYKLETYGKDIYGRTLVDVVDYRNDISLNKLLITNCLAEPFYSNTTDEILSLYNKAGAFNQCK